MAGIFINYRRDDAPGVAGRLFDHLAPKFSRRGIFMDVDAMKPGMDFTKQLDAQVSQCHVLLAVIGPHWLDAKDPEGKRRLDSDHDYVRIELASALKRDIPVIPVLVDGAVMPPEGGLPDDLKPLVRRHALELRHTRFNADADAIMRALEDLAPPRRLPWRPILAGAVAVAGIAAVAVLWPKLTAMLRPAAPPPVASGTSVIANPLFAPARNLPAPVTENRLAPNALFGPPGRPASNAAARNQNPVDGGMQVTIGDSYDAISAAYKTFERPTRSPWDKTSSWLFLKDEGIEFFFDKSNRINGIHFVAPWAGSIHGIKIGDSAAWVQSLLGPPKKAEERFGGDTTALIYRWPYTLTVEFHIKRSSNSVEIIMMN
jgi:hypothetical protein